MKRINESGELSDEDEEALGKAIGEFVDDFGPDFDEEGEPLEEGESDRIKSEEEHEEPGRTDEEADEEAEAEDERDEAERRRTPSARPRTSERGPREGGGDRLDGHAEGRQGRASRASRTFRRSRARWRWSLAARLRRAEQRIDHLRPYAQEIRKMTRQVAEAAGGDARASRCSQEREDQKKVAVLLVTGDRGLAGSFNTQIIRAGHPAAQRELEGEGKEAVFSVVGRRGASTPQLPRRARRASPTSASPTAPPSRTRARSPTR